MPGNSRTYKRKNYPHIQMIYKNHRKDQRSPEKNDSSHFNTFLNSSVFHIVMDIWSKMLARNEPVMKFPG